jgi:hypothetical protein
MKALNRHVERVFNPDRTRMGEAQAQEGPKMTVLIHVNTIRPSQVFANANAAENWFEENDPEGVAFEYEVLE